MPAPHFPPSSAGLLSEIGLRVRSRWLWKMSATMLGMAAFMVVYFWLLRNPQFPVFVMPVIALDRWIPFWPQTLPIYLSLWFYVSFAPALLRRRDELVAYALAALGMSLAGLGIFWLWPTMVPPPDIDWSQYPSFQFLKTMDTAGNACPSLHVAFAVFSAVWFERLGREMRAGIGWSGLNLLWATGICLSTITTRQHVVLDVIAGSILGLGSAAVHLWGLKRFQARATS